MDSSVERVLEYCSSIAREFETRLNRIRAYVPDHNLSAGATNEIILRNFLAQHTTTRYAVRQGFMCDPLSPETVSKQCDILVYDQHHYPLVYSEGEIKSGIP